MQIPRNFTLGLLVAATLLAPLSALAISPIGGKVVSMVPCPHSIGFIVTVVGFGIGTGIFWYLPGVSIAYPYGPPFIGEWILGMSDVPTYCGERITYSGTSPI